MIYLVSGSQRTGTSLAMQLLCQLGIPIVGEAFINGRLKEFNPQGFYDSGPFIENRNLSFASLNGKALKLFEYDFNKRGLNLEELKSLDLLVLLTIRHPLETILSHILFQTKKKKLGIFKGWTKSRCVRNYITNLQFSYDEFVEAPVEVLVLEYSEYFSNLNTQLEKIITFLGFDPSPEIIDLLKGCIKTDKGDKRRERYDDLKDQIESNDFYPSAVGIYEELRAYS
jgi:hypothetical protein